MSHSLRNGITLLLVFSEEHEALGLSEIAELTSLGRSTAHRYATTLVRLGYLEQARSRKYRLAPGAADPGARAIGDIRRSLPARETLEELREDTGYTVSMGVLEGTDVVYVHRLFGHRRGQHAIDLELRVGAHVPAYCTALGKALLASLPGAERRALVETIDLVPQGPRSITVHGKLLAELDRVSLLQPVLSDEELVAGARSIAMLVARPGDGRPVAIEVTVPSAAYTAAQLLTQVGPSVMRATRLISRA
jgi:IclR family pca regulon transcriptional regulator